MTLEQIKKIPATEIAELDKLAELIIKNKPKNYKEQYIVRWYYDNNMRTTGYVNKTYDEAMKAIDDYKRYDKDCGTSYKYRIIKQIIQEEVVYDEL